MASLIVPNDIQIKECAQFYVEAFLQDPWFEDNDYDKVYKYMKCFTHKEDFFIYALEENGLLCAVCMGEKIPCVDAPFFRIEDLCVAPGVKSMGYGSKLISFVEQKAKEQECNCIILATVRNFPSHKFYEKNGFTELEGSVYLYKEI